MADEVADALAKTEVKDEGEQPADNGTAAEEEAAPATTDGAAAAEAADAATEAEPSSDQKVVAKFLVSNAAAGSVIGKAGSNIAEFQTQSSARIQLSRANEYFPGTSDRIMLISGSVGQVLTALHLVLNKMKSEKAVQDTMLSRDGTSQELRLLVPAALCGSIIGKGGATIRQFAEDSKAAIGLSPQVGIGVKLVTRFTGLGRMAMGVAAMMDRMPPGVADRTVRITGEDLEQLMRAVALILTKLAQNPNYSRFTSTSVSYGGFGVGGYGGRAAAGPPQEVLESGPQDEVTVAVPDRAVGAIIGKGGEVINQIKNVVGVRIRVSGRDEFVAGTRDRQVTISGPKEAVTIAEQLIRKKVDAATSSGPPQ